jgi:hypothetical protein
MNQENSMLVKVCCVICWKPLDVFYFGLDNLPICEKHFLEYQDILDEFNKQNKYFDKIFIEGFDSYNCGGELIYFKC